MSMMKCNHCTELVDTDDDPDSLEFVEDECYCSCCRYLIETVIDNAVLSMLKDTEHG